MAKPKKRGSIGSPPHTGANPAPDPKDKDDGPLGEQVYARIKDDIISCVFAPGESCSESQLADRYGVSKAPIRWALAALSRERLVTARARQGYVVAPLTIESVKGLFGLRSILESAAARLAAGRADIPLLKSLDARVGRYVVGDRRSEKAWILANNEFHIEIARASGNDWLFRAILTTLEETRRVIHVSLSMPNQIQTMSRDHRDLIDALANNDGERAAGIAEIHTERSFQAVLAAMVGSSAVQQANFDGRPFDSTQRNRPKRARRAL